MQSVNLLLKVLWSPGEAMFLLSKKPRIVVPLVFLSLFSLVTGGLVMSRLDSAELALRAIERSPQGSQISEEQKELMRTRLNSPIVKALGIGSAIISPAILITIVSGIYFALFTMLGREGGYKAFFSITAFALIPTVIRQVATVAQVFVMPVSQIMPDELGSLSPAVFLNRDSMSPVLFAAVNTVDLATIWILSLLVIGFGFVTRKSLSTAARACTVIAPFLVWVAFRLALAALRGV